MTRTIEMNVHTNDLEQCKTVKYKKKNETIEHLINARTQNHQNI